jgi:hypothetical protein
LPKRGISHSYRKTGRAHLSLRIAKLIVTKLIGFE